MHTHRGNKLCFANGDLPVRTGLSSVTFHEVFQIQGETTQHTFRVVANRRAGGNITEGTMVQYILIEMDLAVVGYGQADHIAQLDIDLRQQRNGNTCITGSVKSGGLKAGNPYF